MNTTPSQTTDSYIDAVMKYADAVYYVTTDDDPQDTEPVVDGYLNRNTISALFGPAGVGKTFLAIDLAQTIASPLDNWHGIPCGTGPVLYVAADDRIRGISNRVKAWEHHHNEKGGVQWAVTALNLSNPEMVEASLRIFRKIQPALIVFDTLYRCTDFPDPPSCQEADIVVSQLDRIREATNAAILYTDYTSKGDIPEAPGDAALRAALDSEFHITGNVNRGLTIHNTKQRDLPLAPPIHLIGQPSLHSLCLTPHNPEDGDPS